jgi:prepilin-type N-terminal cleavage/methylation domain-containing protein
MTVASRPRHLGKGQRQRRDRARGFSMIELLVTIVLAGIVFAAMVPVFASALKATTRDNFRATATNIAQDRIEKIRALNYADITDTNLNDPAFAKDPASAVNEFGGTFTPTGSSKSYTIDPYVVTDMPSGAPTPIYKKINVTVRWSPAALDRLTMQTVVMNPFAVVTGSTPTPSTTPAPYSTTGSNYQLMVSVTDNTVTSAGVTVVRTDVTPKVTQTPAKQIPNTTNGLTVTWSNLIGGPNVVYRVTVYFQVPGYSAESKYTDVTLFDSMPIFFDTNPYN